MPRHTPDTDYSFLNTPEACKARRRTSSNIFEIEGVEYVGVRECYDKFFSKKYPDLTHSEVTRLLNYSDFSRKNSQKYPELSPYNPYRIWDMISRGAISHAKDYKGLKRYRESSGIIYYILDPDLNRYYGFTTGKISDEINHINDMIEAGRFTSCDPDDYEIHVHDIVAIPEGHDKNAREEIDRLIKKFVYYNPDRRAVNLIDFC